MPQACRRGNKFYLSNLAHTTPHGHMDRGPDRDRTLAFAAHAVSCEAVSCEAVRRAGQEEDEEGGEGKADSANESESP